MKYDAIAYAAAILCIAVLVAYHIAIGAMRSGSIRNTLKKDERKG